MWRWIASPDRRDHGGMIAQDGHAQRCPTTACAGRLAAKSGREKSMVPRAGWPVDRRSRVTHTLQKFMDAREAVRPSLPRG